MGVSTSRGVSIPTNTGGGTGGGTGTVTSISTDGLVAGGPITTSGVISLVAIPPSTLIGNVAAGTAAPDVVSNTQITAMLNLFSRSLKGLTPPSGGVSGTANFLREDGTWAAPPTGTGTGGGGITQIDTAGLVAGGPITTTGTISLGTIATNLLLGNVTGTTGAPGTVTQAQLRTLIGTVGTGTAGLMAALPGGTSTFFRGDGTYATPPIGGTGSVTNIATAGLVAGGPISGTGTISLGTIADQTWVGNVSGSPAAPVALTTAQVRTAIGVGGTALTGLVGVSPGGTSAFWRADSSWAAPPSWGTGSVTSVDTAGLVQGGPFSGAGTISLSNIPAGNFVGNNTGTTSAPTAVTPTQATSLLNTVTRALKGLAPASGGTTGTANFLREDLSWAAPPGGGGGSTALPLSVKTAAYTLAAGDQMSVVQMTGSTAAALAVAITAPGTLGAGWWCYLQHAGTGVTFVNKKLVITPASGLLDGQAAVTVYPGDLRIIQCDGTNFQSILVEGGFVEVFSTDSPATVDIPTGANWYDVYSLGGGGSGGSGRVGLTSSARPSGSGGGGGSSNTQRFRFADIQPSQTFTIAGTVAGGAAQSTASTNGNNGTAGGNTTFGTLNTGFGGGAGLGGGTAITTGGSGGGALGAGLLGGIAGVAGGAPSAGVGIANSMGGGGGVLGNQGAGGASVTGGGAGAGSHLGAAASSGGGSLWGGPGGGAGGNYSAGNGLGGASPGGSLRVASGGGGIAGTSGSSGVNGGNGGTGPVMYVNGPGAGGGGGGAGFGSATLSNGGTGAAGGQGAGGGGGGCATDTMVSGAGGPGGPGYGWFRYGP